MMPLLGEVKQKDTLQVIYNTKGDSEIKTRKKNPEKKGKGVRMNQEVGTNVCAEICICDG